MSVSGTLITREYANFKGVDFSHRKDEVSLYHSPDALNVWKNYKKEQGIETRPGLDLIAEYDNTIFGLFFYTVNTIGHMIVHCGVSLYDINMVTKEKKVIKEQGMNPAKSHSFICNNILFIKDGINYLEYNGETLKDVEGTVPLTSISRSPSGGGKQYQDVNLLTGKRQNSFCADGESTGYALDTKELQSIDKVWVNDELVKNYTVDLLGGIVNFNEPPEKPLTEGQDNVKIEFTKTNPEYANRIKKCTMATVFDDRIFFSGNQDYPNYIFHCEFNGIIGTADPRYVSDLAYYCEGVDSTKVKAMIPGNNALWVLKEPSQHNTTIFYHVPTTQLNENTGDYETVYPSTHSSISLGCDGAGINFNDDICFFSNRGMEGITSTDITTEQIIAHRSLFVDSKLLNEPNYKDMILIEWEGYLLVCIDNHIYLADYNARTQIENHIEYNWYYWELPINVTSAQIKDGVLYLCGDNKIYTLTNNDTQRDIEAYWCTLDDEFKYPHYGKTTNKKGFKVDLDGNITISIKINNGEFQKINDFVNTKGYIVAKIKKKKWESMQLKFSNNKPFKINKCIIEAYVGAYLKR